MTVSRNLQRKAWEAALQLGQRSRQQIGRDGGNRAELERPCQRLALVARIVDEIPHRCEHRTRASGDLVALLRQLDARLPPLNQADAKLLLELLDLHAERRLVHRALLRGVTEMQSLGEGLEVAKLSQRNPWR